MLLNQSLEGEKVKIYLTEGTVIIGTVSNYIYSEDNEPENIASIIIDDAYGNDRHCSYPIEIFENEIKTLEII